jgi:hypothetical protein
MLRSSGRLNDGLRYAGTILLMGSGRYISSAGMMPHADSHHPSTIRGGRLIGQIHAPRVTLRPQQPLQ